MTTESRNRSPGIALLAAAATALAFEIVLVALIGPLPPLRYLAFCAVVTAAFVVVAGLLFAGGRGSGAVVAALAVWAAANVALFFPELRGVLLGIGFGIVTGLTLGIGRRVGVPAAGLGVVVGAALCLDLIYLPKVLLLVAGWFPPGLARDVLRVVVFALMLLALLGYAGWRRGRRGWPSETAVALALLAVVAAVTPISYAARPWVTERDDLAKVASGTIAAQASDPAGRPSIVLLVFDTVRADQLSVYGYERDTTPRLRRFLEERDNARLYPFAFSTACWTLPAHASLLTGLLPSAHGAHNGNIRTQGWTIPHVTRIEAETTLAERLKAHGYRTAAISANVQLGATPGLERGFDVFYEPPSARPLFLFAEKLRARFGPWILADTVKPYPSAAAVNREVLRFVDAAGPDGWFVLANYMEAHAPYAAPAPHAGKFSAGMGARPPVTLDVRDPVSRLEHARGRYDEEILSLDAAIGDLLDELERRGVLDRAWVIVTADHGEAFREHGVVLHATGIHNEQVRVPLIVAPPKGESLPRRDGAVGLLDITATISAAVTGEPLGLGHDLRAPPGPVEPVPIEFFGTEYPSDEHFFDRVGELARTPVRAVVVDRTKLLEYPDRRELFLLDEDPQERDDRAGELTSHVDALVPLLPPLDRGSGEPAPSRPLTARELERLRALGYVQ